MAINRLLWHRVGSDEVSGYHCGKAHSHQLSGPRKGPFLGSVVFYTDVPISGG